MDGWVSIKFDIQELKFKKFYFQKIAQKSGANVCLPAGPIADFGSE